MLAFPVAAQAGTLSASPPSSNFNAQPWFFGSQFNNFQVTNSGKDTALKDATITGPDAGRFSIAGDNCAGLTLGDGNDCNVGVVFNPPNGAGSFSAELEIPSDGDPSPLVIPLSAQSLNGPSLRAAARRADFGPILVGEQASQTLTITNQGDFPGGIQQSFIVGPDEFSIADDECTQRQLDPGQSCTLTAVFQPQAAREFQGSIFAINGSGADPVLPINLSGEGRLSPGPAPDTVITQSVPDTTKNKTASFQFDSPTAGVSFECKLDDGPFAPCTSPSTYKVTRGRHSFQVRARNVDGTVDPTPAADTWKVHTRVKNRRAAHSRTSAAAINEFKGGA
jgi:hypothetical protein